MRGCAEDKQKPPNGFDETTQCFCEKHPMVLLKGRRPNRETTQWFSANHPVLSLKPPNGFSLWLRGAARDHENGNGAGEAFVFFRDPLQAGFRVRA